MTWLRSCSRSCRRRRSCRRCPSSMREREGPLASPGYHLWQAALRWKNAVKTSLEKHDLTPTQFFVLGAAGWLTKTQPVPPRQKDVAEMAGIDLMTTSQVVRALEKAGLLARHDA